MVNSLIQLQPSDLYGVLNSSIWWSSDVQLIGHHISYARARQLCKNRLCIIDDIWDMETCESILWQEAKSKFNLKNEEEEAWDLIIGSIMN